MSWKSIFKQLSLKTLFARINGLEIRKKIFCEQSTLDVRNVRKLPMTWKSIFKQLLLKTLIPTMIGLKVIGVSVLAHVLKILPETHFFKTQENYQISKKQSKDTFFASTLKVQDSKVPLNLYFWPIFQDLAIFLILTCLNQEYRHILKNRFQI